MISCANVQNCFKLLLLNVELPIQLDKALLNCSIGSFIKKLRGEELVAEIVLIFNNYQNLNIDILNRLSQHKTEKTSLHSNTPRRLYCASCFEVTCPVVELRLAILYRNIYNLLPPIKFHTLIKGQRFMLILNCNIIYCLNFLIPIF